MKNWTYLAFFWKACAAWNLALASEKRLTRESVRSTKADFPDLAWWSSFNAFIQYLFGSYGESGISLLKHRGQLGDIEALGKCANVGFLHLDFCKGFHCANTLSALPDETTWQVRFKMNFGDIYSVRKQYSSPKSWLKGRRMIYKVHPAGKLYRNIWSNRF